LSIQISRTRGQDASTRLNRRVHLPWNRGLGAFNGSRPKGGIISSENVANHRRVTSAKCGRGSASSDKVGMVNTIQGVITWTSAAMRWASTYVVYVVTWAEVLGREWSDYRTPFSLLLGFFSVLTGGHVRNRRARVRLGMHVSVWVRKHACSTRAFCTLAPDKKPLHCLRVTSISC
jgi:hypothetical protein